MILGLILRTIFALYILFVFYLALKKSGVLKVWLDGPPEDNE
jgi:hypothetical protein